MAVTVDEAVCAAQAGDAAAFGAATNDLALLDPEQIRTLLGEVTRELIERSFPDGLDADDAELLLQGGIRFAAAWYPELDSDSLIRALTGALGIVDPDEAVPVDGPAVVVFALAGSAAVSYVRITRAS